VPIEPAADALVLGHFQEPGLLEIRSSVDIPVIALGEANLLTALSMGQRIELVNIDPIFIPWHDRQVRGHGLGERYVGGAQGGSAPIHGGLHGREDLCRRAR